MVALWKGIQTTPDEMIRKAQLPIGQHSYSFNQTILSARAVGLNLVYKSGATWEVIQQELSQGRPVITLLRYDKISGNQDDFGGSHFWVETGYDDEFVYCNDSDWWGDRELEGKDRKIPISEFKDAIGDPLIATGNAKHQSLFVV